MPSLSNPHSPASHEPRSAGAGAPAPGAGRHEDAGLPLLSGLSVVLPCLDEEDSIAEAIAGVRQAARRVAGRCEIIVVDDGSADATAVIAAAEPAVRVIRHDANYGAGAAVRSALRAAREPYVLITAADNQYDPAQLEALAAAILGADIATGVRARRAHAWRRRLADRRLARAARRAAGVELGDPCCPFQLVRREAVRSLELHSDGAGLPAELLIRCLRAGHRVAEVAVEERPRHRGGRPHPWPGRSLRRDLSVLAR